MDGPSLCGGIAGKHHYTDGAIEYCHSTHHNMKNSDELVHDAEIQEPQCDNDPLQKHHHYSEKDEETTCSISTVYQI